MFVRTVTRALAWTWMPSLHASMAEPSAGGQSITFGLTDVWTASSTSRPARSMAVGALEREVDVRLVRRDQRVDHLLRRAPPAR